MDDCRQWPGALRNLLARFQGAAIDITATKDLLVLFSHATPYREPVVMHGPFVMNTRAAISAAIADYQAGNFGG